jgi:hypothetical protein
MGKIRFFLFEKNYQQTWSQKNDDGPILEVLCLWIIEFWIEKINLEKIVTSKKWDSYKKNVK